MNDDTVILQTTSTVFTTEDIPALRSYNLFMEKNYSQISKEIRVALEKEPEFDFIQNSLSIEENDQQVIFNRKLESDAILKNKWRAYVDFLEEQGIGFARAGVQFSDWYKLTSLYRDLTTSMLVSAYDSDSRTVTLVMDGLHKILDLGIRVITESYFAEKHSLIDKLKEQKEDSKLGRDENEICFQELIENCPDHILMVDRKYRLQYINRVLSEYKVEEVIGANVLDFQSPDGKKILRNAIDHVFKTGQTTIYEIETPLPTGTRHYTSSAAPVFKNSKVVSVAVISRDTTERVQAEQKVARLNHELEKRDIKRSETMYSMIKDLESFTYSVSHDLRTPVRAIDGFAKILRQRLEGRMDEKEAHYLSCVLEGSKKMGILIDDLLAFSRMGRIETRFTNFSLELLFQQVFRDLTVNSDSTRINFFMESLPEIQGDRELLKLAICHMLGNALKYSSKRKKSIVRVKCKEKADVFEIEIRDNGVGFEMEYLHKVFEIFQRLHTDDEFEGSGVGLAIVKKVIDRHGGEVRISSKLGKGTKIYFSLPK